jgi:hypothetical protein
MGILGDLNAGVVPLEGLDEIDTRAPVPATETVTCVRCGRPIRLQDSDVVGLGYRCNACSIQAELEEANGRPDLADNLGAADRARLARRGQHTASVGVLLIGLGLVVPAAVALASVPAAIRIGIFTFKYVISLGALATGLGVGQYLYFRDRTPALPAARARRRLPPGW